MEYEKHVSKERNSRNFFKLYVWLNISYIYKGPGRVYRIMSVAKLNIRILPHMGVKFCTKYLNFVKLLTTLGDGMGGMRKRDKLFHKFVFSS